MELLSNLTAIAFVLHFLWSYYTNCYRKGYTIDVWHYSLFFNMFIIHIMLPFSRSDLNILALGGNLRRMQSHVTEAYFISAFGYFCTLVGGQIWRLHTGLGVRSLAARLIEIPTYGSMMLLRSRRLLLLHATVSSLLIVGVLTVYFRIAGFGFNLSGLLLVMPSFRPIAQFTSFYASFIASYCAARYVVYRERSMLAAVSFIVFGLLFFGSRATVIAIFSIALTVLLIRMRRRLRLSVLVASAFAGLVAVFLLDALRRPHFSPAAALSGLALSVFFGNSFSDTRDFALVLSYWDGHVWGGATYLAALIAFIPRSLSHFRDTWALGVVTATMAGFSPQQHPGLRVGLFGEAYFNFGLIGVTTVGLFLGSVVRLIDLRIKQAVATLPPTSVRAYSYPIVMLLVSVATNSVVASSFYSIGLILILSWGLQRLLLALDISMVD